MRDVDVSLPRTIGAPATRALAGVGVDTLAGLARWTPSELLALHGFGPKALRLLEAALTDLGLSLRHEPSAEGAAAVDAHLAALEPIQRDTLASLRDTLRTVLPHADEGIKYAMPTVMLDGKNVAHYEAFTNHCTYFGASGSVVERVAPDRYETSKGGLKFGLAEKLPVGLVRKLVAARLAEIADVTNGVRREYFPDGARKAEGKMKDGALHGRWNWYRDDGSLLRTGSFVKGAKTGAWTTYDRSGHVVSTSHE